MATGTDRIDRWVAQLVADECAAACVACLLTAVQAAQSAGTVAGSASASASCCLQPLRDHHAITPNVLGALHTRERQLLTVMTLLQDLEDKRARLSAAQLMPASQAKKVSVVGVGPFVFWGQGDVVVCWCGLCMLLLRRGGMPQAALPLSNLGLLCVCVSGHAGHSQHLAALLATVPLLLLLLLLPAPPSPPVHLQVDSLHSQVSQLEVSSAAAEAEYSRQLARNKEELAGLRDTRGRELTAMLVSVC